MIEPVTVKMNPLAPKLSPKRVVRRDARRVSPRYEDSGLFKTQPVSLDVMLVPSMRQNTRRDILIKGFAQGEHEMEVVFAGRRVVHTAELITQLKSRNFPIKPAGNSGFGRGLGLRVQITGSWRPRFIQDTEGWETKQYHFMAAEWHMLQPDGTVKSYGEPPII